DRDLNRYRYRALAFARNRALDLVLAQDLHASNLEEVESFSLLLLTLVRAGSESEKRYGHLLLAAAIAQGMQTGKIPPIEIGIACVRWRVKEAEMPAPAAG